MHWKAKVWLNSAFAVLSLIMCQKDLRTRDEPMSAVESEHPNPTLTSQDIQIAQHYEGMAILFGLN